MSRSSWTHSICAECWFHRNPKQQPLKMSHEIRSVERCCFCFITHRDGIYMRADPKETLCRGVHEE
jgi:hypothetical protein